MIKLLHNGQIELFERRQLGIFFNFNLQNIIIMQKINIVESI